MGRLETLLLVLVLWLSRRRRKLRNHILKSNNFRSRNKKPDQPSTYHSFVVLFIQSHSDHLFSLFLLFSIESCSHSQKSVFFLFFFFFSFFSFLVFLTRNLDSTRIDGFYSNE